MRTVSPSCVDLASLLEHCIGRLQVGHAGKAQCWHRGEDDKTIQQVGQGHLLEDRDCLTDIRASPH